MKNAIPTGQPISHYAPTTLEWESLPVVGVNRRSRARTWRWLLTVLAIIWSAVGAGFWILLR